jgi:HAE1 family hydrophobic/amphiphilic exporter-1
MYEIQQESFGYIFQALVMAVLLTYVVLAMILESFVHPITVMLTLPLGLVGASFGLFFGGQSINIMSLMAMVMLVGIVVNNAILLLDYIGVLRRRGLSMRDAVIDACPVKLRPIIMTNLAIAVGMIPQAMGGAGSEIRVCMAVVTIGGVLISAIFTLIIIPTLYEAFESFIERLKG